MGTHRSRIAHASPTGAGGSTPSSRPLEHSSSRPILGLGDGLAPARKKVAAAPAASCPVLCTSQGQRRVVPVVPATQHTTQFPRRASRRPARPALAARCAHSFSSLFLAVSIRGLPALCCSARARRTAGGSNGEHPDRRPGSALTLQLHPLPLSPPRLTSCPGVSPHHPVRPPLRLQPAIFRLAIAMGH